MDILSLASIGLSLHPLYLTFTSPFPCQPCCSCSVSSCSPPLCQRCFTNFSRHVHPVNSTPCPPAIQTSNPIPLACEGGPVCPNATMTESTTVTAGPAVCTCRDVILSQYLRSEQATGNEVGPQCFADSLYNRATQLGTRHVWHPHRQNSRSVFPSHCPRPS